MIYPRKHEGVDAGQAEARRRRKWRGEYYVLGGVDSAVLIVRIVRAGRAEARLRRRRRYGNEGLGGVASAIWVVRAVCAGRA